MPLLLLLLALAGPASASPRVLVLMQSGVAAHEEALRGFRSGLGEVQIEAADAGTRGERAAEALRAALAAGRPDLVLALGEPALSAAKDALAADPRAPPVVFTLVADPTRLTRGWPRATGVALSVSPARTVEALARIAPRARTLGTVYRPGAEVEIRALEEAARARGLRVTALPATTAADAVRATKRFERELPVDALLYRSDFAAPAREARDQWLEMALVRGLPLCAPEGWVAKGALFGFSFDWHRVGRQAARLARRALAGPASLPPPEGVEEAEWVVNARTARKLGLAVPESADRVYDGGGGP